MKLERVPLASVATIDRRAATDGECRTLPYVGLEHIEKDRGEFSPAYRPRPEPRLALKYRFTSDHVLYGKLRPYLNKVVLPTFDGVCTTEILPIRVDPTVLDRTYLFAVLMSAPFVAWASHKVAGANLPRLSPAMLAEFELPLPPLDEQQRIGRVLSECRMMRRMSEHALELSRSVLPATFVELFGDPRVRSSRWPSETLGRLGTLDRGKSQHRPRDAGHLYGGPYPFIQTGDIANAQGYIRHHTQTYSEEGLLQSKLWPANTLCITIAANIAKTAILTYPVCFPDSVVGFSPGPDVTVEFIQGWFGFLQQVLDATAPEVAQKNINLEILRALQCPVPPLPLQMRYSAIAREHERLRSQQREACRQAEHLFDSLLNEAFSIPA
jgi:type I restriction enzyme S subunit